MKKLKKICKYCLLPVGISICLSACGIFEYEGDCDVPVKKVKVPINLYYDTDFYVWHYDYDPQLGKVQEKYPQSDVYPGYPGTTSKYDNLLSRGVLDVHVKVYKTSAPGVPVLEDSFSKTLSGGLYDDSIELELEAENSYTVAVWSHLRDTSSSNPFYDPSNFYKVGLINDNYKGNTDYRDAFSGTITIATAEEDEETPYEINMKRPMGKFELVTLDLSEFLDRETTRRNLATRASADEYRVQISFPLYYPNSYSVLEDRLENSGSGVSFMTYMTVNGETEASLGFEYVLLNNISDGGVQMRVDIYDPNYTHVAGSTTLTIPMRRDCHTLLRGNFLSEENEGGIGIDPGFNGDFNIPMF